MNWKLCIVAMALPLTALAAEETDRQPIPQEPSSVTGTTMNRYSKPGAPVELTYKAPKLGVGESGDVELTFNTRVDEGDLNIRIDADDALLIDDPTVGEFYIPLSPDSTTYSVSVPVTSTVEGLFYVNVFVTMDIGGNTTIRTFAVPVQVGRGKPQLKSSGGLDTDENGRPIIIMPAEETTE